MIKLLPLILNLSTLSSIAEAQGRCWEIQLEGPTGIDDAIMRLSDLEGSL